MDCGGHPPPACSLVSMTPAYALYCANPAPHTGVGTIDTMPRVSGAARCNTQPCTLGHFCRSRRPPPCERTTRHHYVGGAPAIPVEWLVWYQPRAGSSIAPACVEAWCTTMLKSTCVHHVLGPVLPLSLKALPPRQGGTTPGPSSCFVYPCRPRVCSPGHGHTPLFLRPVVLYATTSDLVEWSHQGVVRFVILGWFSSLKPSLPWPPQGT